MKGKTQKTIIILIISLFVLIFLFWGVVLSAEFKTGDYTFVSKDQVLADDFITAAENIDIDGIVGGDVIAVGSKINIPGNIDGDVMALGGTIYITGLVRDDVRIGGGNINISGKILSDVIVLGGNVNITKESVIEGDVIVYGGTIKIDGEVKKNIKGNSGTMEIRGKIGKDVDISCGTLTLRPDCVISGNLNYISDSEAKIQGKVEGEVTHKTFKQVGRKVNIRRILIGKIISLLSLILIGLILIFLFPQKSNQTADTLQTKPFVSLGIGFALLFLIPIICILLLITVIGIPLALITIALYIISLYISKIFVGLYAGKKLLIYFTKRKEVPLVQCLIIGLIAILIIINIPIIGGILNFIIILFGLGALGIACKEIFKKDRKSVV
jgi:cytoskeletal protein CcmA (bactofilin family)